MPRITPEITVTHTAEPTSAAKEKRLAAVKVLARLRLLHDTHRAGVAGNGKNGRVWLLLSDLRGNEVLRGFAEQSLADVTPSTAFDLTAYAGAMKLASTAAKIARYLGQVDTARTFIEAPARLTPADTTGMVHCPDQQAIDAGAKSPAARRATPFPVAPGQAFAVSTPGGRP